MLHFIRSRWFFAATALASFFSMATSEATQTKSHASYREFKAGEIVNLSLSDQGVLRLGPTLEKVTDIDAAVIWASAYDADANLYLATGHKGVVFKVTPDGEVSRIFEPDEILARALAVKPDGTVFVATSPNGRIYRIEEGKRAEIYFDPPEVYIWDLLLDASGDLYVATGQRARIYRLPADFTPDKVGQVWFQPDHTHITSLAFDSNGDLLAGTAPGAYLYRITDQDTGMALFNADAAEISHILATEEAIYFSTFQQQRPSTASSRRPSPPREQPSEASETEESESDAAANQSRHSPSQQRSRAATRSRAPHSALYRLTSDGFAEILWQQPGVHIYAFNRNENQEWLLGSGHGGELYQVHDSSSWSLLQQAADGGEISAILTTNDGDYSILTSNPARVYRLSDHPAPTGTFTSAVVDADQTSRWGALQPLTYDPLSVEGISWQTRSGNSPQPDLSWSDWSQPSDGRITSPPARYIQYKVDFSSATNGLRRVDLFYRHPNQPPVIERVNVLPVGIEVIPSRTSQRTHIDLNQLIDGPRESSSPASQPRSQFRLIAGPDHIAAGWQARDPNNDPLLFRVELNPLGTADWLLLADELEEPAYSFNTRGLADGYYQLKITADDRIGNTAETARTSYRFSDPFVIDNTPPTIVITERGQAGDLYRVDFEVDDSLSRIVDTRYTLNGNTPRPIAPIDGLFDSRSKAFRLELQDLAPGTHSLVIEAADASGNTSIHAVSFETKHAQ